MKILFCNITYMNHYIGNIEDDVPHGGGAWVKIHKNAHEKWNFLNVNGNCYGFAMNKGDQFHIERIEGISHQEAKADDVSVVWCAPKPSGDTVIVGWYEHATVYRYYQDSMGTPFGLARQYFVEANADDCYLLPEDQRNYVIGRAATDGKGRGFGQSNFWYADSEYAKENIVPNVVTYLQSSRSLRINKTNYAFMPPVNVNAPLTEAEDTQASTYFDENDYMAFLPLGFRAFQANPTGDNAYYLAASLKGLHQYNAAIEWFMKAIEIEGDSWDTTSNLPYLMTEAGRYAEAIDVTQKLLTFSEAKEIEVKHELYACLADNYRYLGDMENAIQYLDLIIAESKDQELIDFTKSTKADWLQED